MKQTVITLKNAKQNHEKITMLTAYDYISAKLMDQEGIHAILVGDSVGMVFCGLENTLSVTLEQMIYHTQAVRRGAKEALIVVDMPFMSYQMGTQDALYNAGRLVKEGGAEAVKLEGGVEVCPQIEAITKAGIPVMGHIGLTPQSVHAFGGFKVQGKEVAAARSLIESAKAVEAAGAFAIVLECIPHELAIHITESITIPTIGIGAGNGCDGQILVYQDLLGMYEGIAPKFVRCYASIGKQMKAAFKQYKQDVQEGVFPSSAESFHMSQENLDLLNKEV